MMQRKQKARSLEPHTLQLVHTHHTDTLVAPSASQALVQVSLQQQNPKLDGVMPGNLIGTTD